MTEPGPPEITTVIAAEQGRVEGAWTDDLILRRQARLGLLDLGRAPHHPEGPVDRPETAP